VLTKLVESDSPGCHRDARRHRPRAELAAEGLAAETFPVSIEQDYVVVEA
jgi:hypothetical protein